MGAQIIGGPSLGLPSAALLESAIRRLPRDALADLCQQLIDRMDAMDPDPDFEETDAEDGFCLSGRAQAQTGPGCAVSDPNEDSDSDYCEASDDRGSSGPNALFRGFVAHKQIEFEEDCERWNQPVHWNA
ncbi:hypothetical protein [Erythrobacter sp. A6_0]|uniref:hypothetical protein n=1 Tax=Erythrobacter sp. A6_0 TaxID=2821089 RepID=UPI001ADC9578|nr:hypothetical protein [Erythrobacter sp. A6_0]MBO9510601.1 hypothetical protein [Erythrobacter sp. A6_0]